MQVNFSKGVVEEVGGEKNLGVKWECVLLPLHRKFFIIFFKIFFSFFLKFKLNKFSFVGFYIHDRVALCWNFLIRFIFHILSPEIFPGKIFLLRKVGRKIFIYMRIALNCLNKSRKKVNWYKFFRKFATTGIKFMSDTREIFRELVEEKNLWNLTISFKGGRIK